MSAFELNKRVILQEKAAGVDATGAPLTQWATIADLWAGIRDLTGRQYVAAKAGQNAVTTTIRIRHRAGVTAAMRVMHAGIAYDIEAVLGTDGRWLDLMCMKGASSG
jgi:SPP1 family predicted phage head-tail adaptor